MKNILKKFLIKNADLKFPVLLGLSGGPDSMALFHLLVELKNEGLINFAIAHVNHNWRAESPAERDQLKEMAFKTNVSFHLLEIDPENLKGNLELACRLERIKFFKTLCDEFSYQAVILGHHLDDQAETVLKRLFEGATLPRLRGLKNKTVIEGLTIWRPFLESRKRDIEHFLKEKNLMSFYDSTNQDPKFMRARFRTEIIPGLSLAFGKDITEPLYRLGIESLELDEYFNEKFKSNLSEVKEGDAGCYLDFSKVNNLFEIKYLIRLFTDKKGFFMSHAMVSTACHLLQTNASIKSMAIGGKNILFDRKKMFILSDSASKLLVDLSQTEKRSFLRLSFNIGFY